jgi:hypothetical protein
MLSVPSIRANRRIVSRQTVDNKIIRLEAKLGAPLVNCLLLDWSERGARLVIINDIELARIVHVVVGDVRKAAWVVWRKEAEIGVEYLSAAPPWEKFRDHTRKWR